MNGSDNWQRFRTGNSCFGECIKIPRQVPTEMTQKCIVSYYIVATKLQCNVRDWSGNSTLSYTHSPCLLFNLTEKASQNKVACYMYHNQQIIANYFSSSHSQPYTCTCAWCNYVVQCKASNIASVKCRQLIATSKANNSSNRKMQGAV